MQQPKEQVLTMDVAGVLITVSVDLSSLPPSEKAVSFPMRVTAMAKEPFKVYSLNPGPELDSAAPVRTPTMAEIFAQIQDLTFGEERPDVVLIGKAVGDWLATYRGSGFDGKAINGVAIIPDYKLPNRAAVYLNFSRLNDRRYNAIVEYTI